jgi:lysophospholipase L1-like esterase
MKSTRFGTIGCAVVFLLFGAPVFAETPKFQAGDRVGFVGDSITHDGGYQTQVMLFYATRFPERRFEAWNCGISGDSAGGAVKRYAWDIASHQPTVATIMLGMNDVGRYLYEDGKSGAAVEKLRREAIAANLANLDQLAGRLTRDGARVVFITPSLFDETGNQKTAKSPGVNGALKACAEGDRQLAAKYHAGLVDFNGPMEEINRREQAKDPNFTLIGGDRIHPGAVGHLVMAYLFLKAQGMSPTVAAMEIDAAKGVVLKQDNCTISKLSAKDGTVIFDCLEKALPFPVDAASETALALIPFMDDLNQETLKVSGLPAGDYGVLIDGRLLTTATATVLNAGINLADIPETPQYRQAREVQNILNERAGLEQTLRNFAQVEHWLFSDLKTRTPELERKMVADKLAELHRTKGQYNDYFISVLETYQKSVAQRTAVEHQMAERLDQAYAANQPKPHRYEIRPARLCILSTNLIENGSFAETANGWTWETWAKKPEPGGRVTDASPDRHCYRLHRDGDLANSLVYSVAAFKKDAQYVLSLAMKCEDVPEGDVEVRILCFGPGQAGKVGPLGWAMLPPGSGVCKLIGTGGTYAWRTFSVVLPPEAFPPDTNNFMLFISRRENGKGSLFIDDVSLVTEAPKKLECPNDGKAVFVAGVNLLPGDTSFETGVSEWGGGGLDTTEAFHGAASLKLPAGKSGGGSPRYFRLLEGGRPYVLSLYAKSSAPAQVKVEIWNQSWTIIGSGTLQTGTVWKRFAITLPSQSETGSININVSKPETSTLWLDAIQVNAGEKVMGYSPSEPLSIGLSGTGEPGEILLLGSAPLPLKLRCRNNTAQ